MPRLPAMTAEDVLADLTRYFDHNQTGRYHVRNVYFFAHDWGESDFLTFSKAGLIHEIEVKVSVSDFRADFAKPKHRYLSSGDWCVARGSEGYGELDHHLRETVIAEVGANWWPRCTHIQVFRLQDPAVAPNRFSFAVPEALVDRVIGMLPTYAGLYACREAGLPVQVRKAPVIHTGRNNFTSSLLDKYWYNHHRREHDLIVARHRLTKLEAENAEFAAYLELRNQVEDFRDFLTDFRPRKK